MIWLHLGGWLVGHTERSMGLLRLAMIDPAVVYLA
jgi:3,4-dihydroxy-2-butanone 4-phosphate synthase